MNQLFHHFGRYIDIKSTYFRLFLIIAGIIIVGLLAHWFKLNLPGLEAWIKHMGVFAPLAYILLFIIGTPFFLSVDALCLTAGALFPLTEACFYVVISTYLAAAIIFFLGRNVFRDRVTKLLANHPKLQDIGVLIEGDVKVMLLLRLLPLPFALLSYAFSVTQVRFIPYIVSTSGILVYHLTLVYLGYGAKNVFGSIHSANAPYPTNYPLFLVGSLVTIIIFAGLVKITQKKLCLIASDKSDYQQTNDKN